MYTCTEIASFVWILQPAWKRPWLQLLSSDKTETPTMGTRRIKAALCIIFKSNSLSLKSRLMNISEKQAVWRINETWCYFTGFRQSCMTREHTCFWHFQLCIHKHDTHQILYCPNNSLSYINCRVIKNTLKYKSCSNMFRFTQEPSSGSQSQCLAKITGMVPLCLSMWTLSVLWRHMLP